MKPAGPHDVGGRILRSRQRDGKVHALMFNNPFRERAIAASANRQQLDRLLRVTAPHERIALVAVGLILVVVGAWALFGTIDREVALDCVLLVSERRDKASREAPLQAEDAGDRRLGASMLAAPRVARLLHPGMPASVEVQLPDRATRRLEGSVSTVAAGWSPAWNLELPATAADSTQRVDVYLPPMSGLEVPNGTPCRARIDLGPHSLAELLGLGST